MSDSVTEPAFSEELAVELREYHGQPIVVPLGGGIPTTTVELVQALIGNVAGEVFIEIDRGVVADIDRTRDHTVLLPYLYPVAVRYDKDDVIIHITDGDTAQFGRITKEG